MPTFAELLSVAIAKSGGHVCIGLDPDPEQIPATKGKVLDAEAAGEAIQTFCKNVVEATRDVAAAYKPNVAFFERWGSKGWTALEWIVPYIRVSAPDAVIILDGKREDIGNTARFYAGMAFAHLKVDAVTAGPYLGVDSYGEFLKDPARGCFLLCRTSNKSAREFQDQLTSQGQVGLPLYQVVALQIAHVRKEHPNLGAVAGATYPDELAGVRSILPDAPLLIPGVGKQGADVVAAVQAARGGPFVVNSSSGIIFAPDPRAAAIALRDQINAAL